MDRPLAPTEWRSRIQQLAWGMLPVALIGVIVSFTGCTSVSSLRATLAPYEHSGCCCINEMKLRAKAKGIWREKYAHCYGNRSSANDIKQGFIDGFVETAQGGSGCPPMIAPQSYGGLSCLTGRKVVPGSWFEGYPLGAAAAESCGSALHGQSRLNPQLLACFVDEGCMAGCRPCQSSGCGCGQTSCSGGCGGAMTFGSGIQTIQTGMPDSDGAIIFEHSTAPTPVPAGNLPAPTGSIDQNAPSLPAPNGAVMMESNSEPEAFPFDLSGLEFTEESTSQAPVEMPNVQVRFDLDEDEWMFGDVDVVHALLQTERTKI